MKLLRPVFIVLLVFSCSVSLAQFRLKYPETRKEDVSDDYFGTMIADPYRWLEDDNSAETKAWVEAQNKLTETYLSGIPFRKQVRERLEQLWNYPRQGAPFKRGNWYYFYKNDGLQNQSVLYRQKGLTGKPEVFLDPNKLSADGTAALGTVSFSKSGKYAAYQLAQSGSDWQEIFIVETATGKLLAKEKLQYIKFSGISWKGDEGFYYSRYPKPDEKTRLSRANEFHSVYYHKIGAGQEGDELIFKDDQNPRRNAGAYQTEDNRFMILRQTEGTSGAQLTVHDLKLNKKIMIGEGFKTEPTVIDHLNGKVILLTNDGAPNYRLVLVDMDKPGSENWVTLVPEQPEVLNGVGTGGGYLFLSYLKDASTRVFQYSYEGKMVRELKLPGIGTASGFGGQRGDREFFYSFSSFNMPPTVYRYNMATGKSSLHQKTEVSFDPSLYEVKQVFFNSKDGTRVPVFLTFKKGIKLDGNNPVMLYGYGGFNIPMTPGFSVSNLFFVEQGGIYAVVNLRGGNEYGEAWHKAGMLENKQNVFDDFIGAAEYLIAEKYTNKEKIAIRGGSNGGLLVGACMNQRPDLFKVAIPQVGVMDMLRYHKFTIGWAWATEYGRSDKKEQFDYLIRYSPLHNINKGVKYPATLITTADHDDRVVPAHSFKFAATLQDKTNGAVNPSLIRIESKAGHGAGKPTGKQIEEAADIWSFVMYNLGMKPVK